MHFFTRLHLTFVLLTVTVACSTDFEPAIHADPVPVVYGVISQADSAYSIRLTRTFIGPGNAYDQARVADSIYFKDARVFLETRNQSGAVVGRSELIEQEIGSRMPGIFAEVPNRIFSTSSAGLPIAPEVLSSSGLGSRFTLHLTAIIPGVTDTVCAVTALRTAPRITEPRFIFNKVYLYTEEPFWMQWIDTNEEGSFEILVRMHYTEFLDDDQRDRIAEWVLTGIEANMTGFPGGERKAYSYYFRPESFYSKVATHIPEDRAVEARLCKKLDFTVLSSNREMEYYRAVYAISDDYHGTTYTNIRNGFGIFTTYSATGITGLELGRQEADSLAYGKYTRHLKFRSY